MEINIDYRLDLFNAVDKFNENMNSENDALFIISRSTYGDNFSALTGNIDLLIVMLSRFGSLEILNNEQKESYQSMQYFILSSALSILEHDKDKKQIFIEALNENLNKL